VTALYHERRESENGYAELKTRLRGAAFILRSRSPELVRQELFAFLTVYQALCALEAEAARQAGIDPDRISFTVTVRIARDHAASHAIITPRSLDLARRQAIGDLISDLLPRRRDRHYERVRKQPKNNFPAMVCYARREESYVCRQATLLMCCCAGDEGFVALRRRSSGNGVKPPHGALAEDCCAERWGKGVVRGVR
jgi:hypothetical protein